MEIKPEDCKITTYLLPGLRFGADNVGVTVRHTPTNTTVHATEAEPEHVNFKLAMEKLRAALKELYKTMPIPEQKTGDLPVEPYSQFKAMAQGSVDYEVDVMYINTEDYGRLMCICTDEATVYITREQAKRFFAFKD